MSDSDRARALVERRRQLEAELDRVRHAQARHAAGRVRAGEEKKAVAASLGVSRPTLDKWLDSIEEAEPLAYDPERELQQERDRDARATPESWTWAGQRCGQYATLRADVATALADTGIDVDMVADAYRAEINAALAEYGIALEGDTFIGPYDAGQVDLGGIVAAVDFWAVVQRVGG